MMLGPALTALVFGDEIRQTRMPELHYKIAQGKLLMYSPRSGAQTPITTAFTYDDIIADDWEIVKP